MKPLLHRTPPERGSFMGKEFVLEVQTEQEDSDNSEFVGENLIIRLR